MEDFQRTLEKKTSSIEAFKPPPKAEEKPTPVTPLNSPEVPQPSVLASPIAATVKTGHDNPQQDSKKLQQPLRAIEQEMKKQRKDFTRKNKKLTQQLQRREEEKAAGDRLLKAKESQVEHLIDENQQFKSKMTEANHEIAALKSALEQKQIEFSAERQLLMAEQVQKNAAQQQREAALGQRLREQQTAFHSISAKNNQLQSQIRDSQTTVELLRKELKQTATQLATAQQQIAFREMDRACDKTAAFKKVESLQREIERLQALLLERTPAQWRGTQFSFSSS